MKVKAIAIVSVVLLASALVLPGFASAGEMKGDLSIGYYSNYVWRGQTLSGDWVVQPEVNLSYEGFGVGLWSNYDSETEEMNETDFILNYARSSDKINYEVGYMYYRIDEASDTQEFYLTVAHDSLLKPYASFFWDTQKGSGGFLELGAGYSHPVTEGVSIDLGADISMVFQNGALGRDENGEEFTGLYNCDLSIGTTIPIVEMWSVEATAAYTFALSDDAEWAIEQASVDGESSLWWWGLALTMAF
jgi:hypothetical protein